MGRSNVSTYSPHMEAFISAILKTLSFKERMGLIWYLIFPLNLNSHQNTQINSMIVFIFPSFRKYSWSSVKLSD